MALPHYFDHQATTPVDPRVVEAMAPSFASRFGHPASRHHAYGWDAEKDLETARARVADLLGAEPREIVFTSGGAEADNLAIRGTAEVLGGRGRHLVTTGIEGRPVLDCCTWLEGQGFEITRVGVDSRGRVDPDAVAAAIRDDTILVSVQAANPEVGTRHALAAIGAACEARGVRFHTDASFALATDRLDVREAGVHLLSLSGHRLYAPKGIGALYVRRRAPRVRLAPLILGGGHERGLRGGTVNVPGAVGLGRAAELCRLERAADAERLTALRDRLESALLEVGDVRRLGDADARLPGVTAVAFGDVEGEALVLGASRIAFATGSACTSATMEPSYVLQAMGLGKPVADTAVRLGLGRFTTEEAVDAAAAAVTDAVRRIRGLG